MKQRIEVRNEFARCDPFRPGEVNIEISDDEWIVNVESVPPNSAIGSGTRVWVARLATS